MRTRIRAFCYAVRVSRVDSSDGRPSGMANQAVAGSFVMISRISSAVSLGVLPTLTPAASRASFLAAAVPDDPETMAPVPADGETMGEIMFRGNITMKGYLSNPAATDAAFAGGWFHTGDLAVTQGDGYMKIRDRSKDIIISGGENISSIEVEDVLYKHPAVAAAAVVAKEDAKWGETPCAFVETRPGSQVSADEIIAWCRENLARYKCPRHVVFVELPKTSTGKIQKFKLRDLAKGV